MSGGKRMDDLLAAAAPSCHECGNPVQRVEQSWHQEGGEWRLARVSVVCAEGHRVPVEPFDDCRPGGG